MVLGILPSHHVMFTPSHTSNPCIRTHTCTHTHSHRCRNMLKVEGAIGIIVHENFRPRPHFVQTMPIVASMRLLGQAGKISWL